MASEPLHVLVVSSEEFVPPHDPLKAIFDRDQALALQHAGLRVGVVSVEMTFPAIPQAKRAVRGLAADPRTVSTQLRKVATSVGASGRVRTVLDAASGLNVIRASIGEIRFHDALREQLRWARAAYAAYSSYVEGFGAPDILHAHNVLPAGAFCAELSRMTGIPFVITEHNTAFARGLVDQGLASTARVAYADAAARLAVSPPLGDLLLRDGWVSDYEWVPDVLDETVFGGAVVPYPPGRLRLLNVGALEPHKGQADLIAAVAQARQTGAELQLHIVGEGPDRAHLESLVEASSLAGTVRFLGPQSRSGVKQQIEDSHALVIASHNETFGVVAIEALACGRPVIATRCGGPEAIVDRSVGLLVPVGDIDAMAAALIELASEYNRFDPAALQNRVIRGFGRDAFVNRITSIYAKVAS